MNGPGLPSALDAAAQPRDGAFAPTPFAVLAHARAAGVTLSERDGALVYRGPNAAITPEFLAALRAHKPALLELLRAAAGAHEELPAPLPAASVHVPSLLQERLWLAHQMNAGSAATSIPLVCRFRGAIDAVALEAALRRLVHEHDVLRTVFEIEHGALRVRVRDAASCTLRLHDFADEDEAARNAACERAVREAVEQPFDLAHDVLLRASLIRLAPDDCVFVLVLSHLAADAASLVLLCSELAAHYEALVEHAPSAPPVHTGGLQYADFAAWQQRRIEARSFDAPLRYWTGKLGGRLPVLRLAGDHARPNVLDTRGSVAAVALTPEFTRRLRDFAQAQGTTPYVVLLCAFLLTLYRRSSEPDLLVGTPVAGRAQPAFANLVGPLANILVLRNRLAPNESFLALLAQAKKTWLEALSHEVPFELLLQTLRPERSTQHSLFFQAMLDVQMAADAEPALRLGGHAAEPVAFDTGSANFDLHLTLGERAGALEGVLVYRSGLFDADTAKDIARDFVDLAERALGEPKATVERLLAPNGLVKKPIVVAANFLADPLLDLLDAWLERLHVQATIELVPPDALNAALLDRDSALSRNADGLNLVLLDPGQWSAAPAAQEVFLRALHGRARNGGDLHCLVLESVGADVADAGERLLRALAEVSGVRAHDARSLSRDYGVADVAEPMAQAAAQLPYTENYFLALATRLARLVWRRHAKAHKVLVVDCDYTLWDGACSERAIGDLVIDANRLRFQQRLLQQVRAGALLCLCSRNEEADVLEVFRSHPQMAIRLDTIAAYRINHQPKVRNIESIAAELNLSSDDFVFIDDDPLECAEVARQLPGVLWLQFPREATAIGAWVDHQWVLDEIEGSAQAPVRAQFYADNAERRSLAARYATLRTLLQESRFSWSVREAGAADEERIAELTRRTNQFNLAKEPLSRAQVAALRAERGAGVWVLDAHDRFGDYGMVGAALTRRVGEVCAVEQFVLSCRAMNRGVEYALLREIAAAAARDGETALRLPFRAAPKNLPARRFLQGLAQANAATFAEEQGCTLSLATLAAGLDALEAGVLDKPFADSEAPPAAARAPAAIVRAAPVQADLLRQLAAGLPDLALIRKLARRREKARDVRVEYVAPSTELQRMLADVVGEHLHVEQLGIRDDLFALGMDSLRALQIASSVRKRGYAVAIDELFEHRTIEELAELCAGSEAPQEPESRARAPFAGLDAATAAALRNEGIEDAYPLSSTQAGMVFHADRDTDSPLYQVIDSFRLRGPFDAALFVRALEHVVAKHPALRTSFEIARFARPMQLVHRAIAIPLQTIDLCELGAGEAKSRFEAWLAAENMQRFKIAEAPLVRYAVHLFGDDVFQVTLTQHHAMLDGWSLNSLVKDLLGAYARVLGGRALAAASAPVPAFADFIDDEVRAGAAPEQRVFWERSLAGLQASPVPRWPGSAAAQAILAEASHVVIPLSLSRALFEAARLAGTPIKSVLLAAHLRVVMYLTGNADVVTGLLVNGRAEGGQGDRALGLFVNSVPLRVRFASGSWLDLIRLAFEREREIQPHRLFPLNDLQRMSEVRPLFEFLFTFTHFHVLEGVRDQRHFEVLDTFNFVRDNFPLQAFFDIDPFGQDRIRLMLGYDAAKIPPAELDRIAALYFELLAQIGANPEQSCVAPTLPQALSAHLRVRAPAVSPAALVPVHRQVARFARSQPDKIALAMGGWQLSYAALDRSAAAIAAVLRARGAGCEGIVAVALETGPKAVAAILGVLYAGAAYLPVDPTYPPQRVAWMLEDSSADLLIVDAGTAALAEGSGVAAVAIDDLLAGPAQTAHADAGDDAGAELAYVIYTSGSTGRPKGVMISHAALAHLFVAARERFELGSDEVWSLFHSLSFDFSVWEMWAPLVSGATLAPIPPAERLDPAALNGFLADHGVTVLNLTPSAVARLLVAHAPLAELAARWPVRRLIVGGEALPRELGRDLLAARIAFWNFYGPTEAAVWTSAVAVRDANALETLGRPLGEMSLDVLNAVLQPAPVAVPGELHIGGLGLARGYHRRPALTAERFVPDPLARGAGARVYRTGDIGRYREQGEVQYLERKDDQFKLRGYRIELGEIESALTQAPEVERAVCVLAADAEAGLTGYYTLKPGATLGQDALRRQLEQRLPPYMIPARLSRLDAIPLGPNGKVDRRALAALAPATVEAAPPAFALDADELVAAEVWSAVLGVAVDASQADFFQLGGDSVKAAQATARLRLKIGAALPLRELFRCPVLKDYAAMLPRYRGNAAELFETFPARTAAAARAPLTHAQRRLWLVDQLVADKAVYVIPVVFECRGTLDVDALEGAVRRVMQRQKQLAVRVTMVDGEPMQEYAPAPPLVIERVALEPVLRALDDAARGDAIAAEIRARVQVPFDLAQGPLLRIAVLDAGDGLAYVVGAVHHLVADAWSVALLRAEIVEQYRALREGGGAAARDLDVDYFDYALWQDESIDEERLASSYAFWRERLRGGPGRFVLGGDPPQRTDDASAIALQLAFDGALTQELKALARRLGVTLFSLLLAAFKCALRALSGQADLWVGSGVSNRTHPRSEEIVGLFVNTLVFRTCLEDGWSFAAAAQAVHAQVVAAREHQHVPYEELVRLINPPRAGRERPLFHALFELHNAPNPQLELPDAQFSVVEVGNGFAKYGLSLQLQEAPGGLGGVLEAEAGRYTAEQARALIERFRFVLRAALQDADAPLARLTGAQAAQALAPNQRRQRHERLSRAFARATAAQDRGENEAARAASGDRAGLPRIIESGGDARPLATWIRAHRGELDASLARHGAILFRGFDADNVARVRAAAAALMNEILPENGEHVPVDGDGGGVQTPVFYAPRRKLLWHNENTFNDRWPRRLVFACARPADSGGETPLVDSREVFRRIPPALRETFERKGVMYVRNYDVGLGLSWSQVFATDSRAAVEERCRRGGFSYEWRADGSLRTTAVRPAVWQHPDTREWVWCNQAQHWHLAALDALTRAYVEGATSEERYPRTCYYGDGTPIPDEAMRAILCVYEELETTFAWQRGDLLLVDNLLTAHARNPFTGERKLFVVLGDTFAPQADGAAPARETPKEGGA